MCSAQNSSGELIGHQTRSDRLMNVEYSTLSYIGDISFQKADYKKRNISGPLFYNKLGQDGICKNKLK